MIRKSLLILLIYAFSGSAYAINCADKITYVIVHSNGNIYFNTANTCRTHWCVLGQEKWNTSDKLKSGLSILLAANTTKRDVVIEWDDAVVPDCTTAISLYATPGFVLLK